MRSRRIKQVSSLLKAILQMSLGLLLLMLMTIWQGHLVLPSFDKIFEDPKEIINLVPGSSNITEIENTIFEYTNKERRLQGLKRLRWDSKLAEIARDHSLDMAENFFYSHDNLRGEDPNDRARRHGYSYLISENIAKTPVGYVDNDDYIYNDAESIGKELVRSWMGSKGHRENILYQHDALGVGCAYDGEYYVCTQNFR